MTTLPKLIEICPLRGPVQATVSIPGSKSMTNRALILAAQRKGISTIHGALWSDDTAVMVDCLIRLGFKVDVSEQADNPSNRALQVLGWGGGIPRREAELYVGNSGTTARFITAFCALAEGRYRIVGDERMHERPMSELFAILSSWGIEFSFEGKEGHLPVRMTVPAQTTVPDRVKVDLTKSSQFASALELVSKHFGFRVETEGHDDDHYFQLTKAMMRLKSADIHVEPDASSATYFWAAESLLPGSRIEVRDWPAQSLQIDSKFAQIVRNKPSKISRRTDLGDSSMMAAVLGSFWPRGLAITDAARMREQETDRLAALEKELGKCGAKCTAHESWLEIKTVPVLHGAEIETYNDHRMAMAFAVLGLKVPGMRIRNPKCVSKTFPNFFETLQQMALQAGSDPVVIDARSRKPLSS